MDILAEAEPIPPKPWSADAEQAASLDLVGEWYWGTTGHTLSLSPQGYLVLGTPGCGAVRGSGPSTGPGWASTGTTRGRP